VSWPLMPGDMVCIRFRVMHDTHHVLGKTTSSQSDEDLSINVLVEDFCALLQTIYSDVTAAPNLMVIFIFPFTHIELMTL
jgi:hypothetical protein